MRSMVIRCALIVGCLSVLSACVTTGADSRTGRALVNLQKEAGQAHGTKIGLKTGSACSVNYLGLIAMGDSTLVAAMTAGNINQVSTVDYHYTQFFGLYGEVCTVVTGD